MGCSTTNNSRSCNASSFNQQAASPNQKPGQATLEVAQLSDGQISHLSRNELIRLIRSVELSFVPQDFDQHLAFGDRQSLERLAHMARRCCRHQIAEVVTRSETPDASDQDISEISSGIWRR